MITEENMKIEDFLAVMAENSEIYPEFAKLPDEQQRYIANVNIITGEAKSIYEDGRLVAVCGVRFLGVGEAWMITPANIRSERKLSLLKHSRQEMIRMRDENDLWRIFAESRISKTFLKHLEFEPHPQGYVWTRK
jgi:hypothetical protein